MKLFNQLFRRSTAAAVTETAPVPQPRPQVSAEDFVAMAARTDRSIGEQYQRADDAMATLLLAGAESLAEALGRKPSRRSGEDQAAFETRRARERTYHAIASAIAGADPSRVFDQLVEFGKSNPGAVLSDVFERQIARNTHLLNLVQVVQRLMRSCTSEAFFAEGLAERREAKVVNIERDHHEGVDEFADEADLPMATAPDWEPEMMTHRQRLQQLGSVTISEALERLYVALQKFHIGLQGAITGFPYEPRMLSAYSVLNGDEWQEATTIAEARQMYHRAREERRTRQTKMAEAALRSLDNAFG